jgi:hypothetical protein
MQWLGYVAGAIISTSALPRFIGIMRVPDLARAESLSRNSMLCAGNVLWVAYGALSGTIPITVMCGIAAMLNGFVLFAALLARHSGQKT